MFRYVQISLVRKQHAKILPPPFSQDLFQLYQHWACRKNTLNKSRPPHPQTLFFVGKSFNTPCLKRQESRLRPTSVGLDEFWHLTLAIGPALLWSFLFKSVGWLLVWPSRYMQGEHPIQCSDWPLRAVQQLSVHWQLVGSSPSPRVGFCKRSCTHVLHSQGQRILISSLHLIPSEHQNEGTQTSKTLRRSGTAPNYGLPFCDGLRPPLASLLGSDLPGCAWHPLQAPSVGPGSVASRAVLGHMMGWVPNGDAIPVGCLKMGEKYEICTYY